MTISFAGVELLLEDPEGEAAKHVQRYLEWPNSQINAPARTIDSKSRVQRPRWPDMPKLRPNQLYCPTGATRWGQFIGLATKAQKDAILAAVSSTAAVGTLVFSIPPAPTVTVAADIATIDGATFNLQAEIGIVMWLLPPVPVSQNDDTLWIIPLVDDRFRWQHQMFVSTATTWAGLQTEIETALGLSPAIARDTASDVNRLYGIPDACIFRNGAINAAAALDLYCWATNQRLVKMAAGAITYTTSSQWVLRSVTPSDLYQLERDAQLDDALSGQSAAGGDFSQTKNGDVPKTIKFRFTNDGATSRLVYSACPDWVVGTAYVVGQRVVIGGNVYTYTTAGTSAGSGPTGTGTGIADGTAICSYVGTAATWAAGGNLDVMCPATATGSNDSDLKVIADLWASEFWQWSKWRFSWGWNRILDWHFTGYEDYALYDLSRIGRGRYQARTFVKSMPPLGWGADFVPVQLETGGNSCGGTGGSGVELSHGVIIESCNSSCSTYRVQRVHRYLKAACDDCGSGSGS